MANMRSGVVVESTQTHTQHIKVDNYSNNHNLNNNNKHNNNYGNYKNNYVNNNNNIDSSCMKDKKKKNRRSRRSKQNSSSFSTSVSLNESNYAGPRNEVSFISMPNMHLSEGIVQRENRNIQNQKILPVDMQRRMCFNSSPDCIVDEEDSVGSSYVSKDLSRFHHSNGFHSRRKYFAPHFSAEDISNMMERGNVFKASFRVNAHNRFEAYCKIEGVQTDILINGLVAQNRAIEGDLVAIEVDPPSLWTKMKGLAGAINGFSSVDECPLNSESAKFVQDSFKGKNKVDEEHVYAENGVYHGNGYCSGEILHPELLGPSDNCFVSGDHLAMSDLLGAACSGDRNQVASAVENLSAIVNAYPSKRPTGRVVGIIERSPRRETVVGFLNVKQWILSRDNNKRDSKKHRQSLLAVNGEYMILVPTDARFPRAVVTIRSLPECIKKMLEASDATAEMDLVAARIVDWGEENYLPEAHLMHVFGRGGEIEAHIAAILFENAIDASEFSSEALSCLPHLPWDIPPEEYESRRDFRKLCLFTIDPANATDLDDALSLEKLSNGNCIVGVHIADVSYFVLPDTALDIAAQIRSTSVYLLRSKLPMLPPLLSENLGSLNPGVDRLAFSILWDIDPSGKIIDRWIGRSIIRSCCKLSYEQARDIVDGAFHSQSYSAAESNWPKLHGDFEWSDIIRSVKSLHEISRALKENRFNDGALSLECPKAVFLFDEDGIPYDSVLDGRKDSNFLVEEFMLLANRTTAEVITRAYPSCALLRRHPEPNLRKLKGFEAFCSKHGLDLDTSSSGLLHQSLERIRGELKNDSVLFDILMSNAAKPMQLAAYFCSGDLKETGNGWGHYALAVPLYTHFTSPLRRYPDIVVHRTLAAAVEAEDIYLKRKRSLQKLMGDTVKSSRCFTGVCFDKDAIGSREAQEALTEAASTHRVPCTETLADVAAHCNERELASRHVKDATEKLYMWVLLKKKETLFSEARVLGLGPKFMSIYIHKLAIERRIYYDEVEGLTVEWLDNTSTLVLSQSINKRVIRRGSPSKGSTLEEVALVISPRDFKLGSPLVGQYGKENNGSPMEGGVSDSGLSDTINVEPAVFPLTVCLLSKIPVALHATGGEDGPREIGARLYISSYFK